MFFHLLSVRDSLRGEFLFVRHYQANVRLIACEPDPAAFVAVIVPEYAPALATVPEMIPLVELSERPGGRVGVTENVTGVFDAKTESVNGTLTLPVATIGDAITGIPETGVVTGETSAASAAASAVILVSRVAASEAAIAPTGSVPGPLACSEAIEASMLVSADWISVSDDISSMFGIVEKRLYVSKCVRNIVHFLGTHPVLAALDTRWAIRFDVTVFTALATAVAVATFTAGVLAVPIVVFRWLTSVVPKAMIPA